MVRGAEQPGSREWRFAQLAFCGAVALWPAVFGWSLGHGLGAVAFLLLFVWLPGRALVAWTMRCESVLERALLSWTAGMAVLGLYFVATCALDERGAWWILPLGSLLALLVARRERPESAPLTFPVRLELLLLALVLALALARALPERPEEWFLGYSTDDAFHAANAAELRWRWPLGDPRLAGEPLRYHFLSYTVSAAMGRVLDLPVRECLLGLTPHFTPLVFALGVFVLARRLGAGIWIGAGSALVLVLHADLGELALPLSGSNWSQMTPFYVGLYRSVTNSAGLCLLLALLLVLHSLLARGAPGRGAYVLGFVLALAASATKSSVLPPLFAGLCGALLWKLARREGLDRRLASAAALVLLGALPAMLWLLADSGGYAQTMFRWLPAHASRASPFAARVGELLGVAHGEESALFSLALLPLWLLFFFGLASVGIVLWLRAREARRDPLELPLACALVAGMLPACLLASPGHSQLFFGYISVLAAALLGALGAQRLFARPSPNRRVLAGLAGAGLCLYGAAALSWNWLRPTLPIRREGGVDEYRAALEWMRESLPIGAVVLADDVRMSVGTWSERRMFYSTPRFAPRQRARWTPLPSGLTAPEGEPPYADRERAQRSFLLEPTPERLARIRELLGGESPLFALRSRAHIDVKKRVYRVEVPPREGADALAELPGAEPVFENESVAIYRLP